MAKGKWSGDFPPPGAGDGKVRMPEAQWGCLMTPVAAVIGPLLRFYRTFIGNDCVADGSCCQDL